MRLLFQTVLGRDYKPKLSLLIAVIFLPPAYFIGTGQVKFDASKFTEEWLKVWICGVVLFFLLEFARHRQEDRLRSIELSSLTVEHLLPHLEELRALVRQMLRTLESGHWERLSTELRVLHRNQLGIGRCLSAFKGHLAPTEVEQHALAAEIETDYWQNIEHISHELRSASDIASIRTEHLSSMEDDIKNIIYLLESQNGRILQ